MEDDPSGTARRDAILATLARQDVPLAADFDMLAGLARRALGCPVALISLLDDSRQWFLGKCGTTMLETAREHAFCAHTVDRGDVLIVEDARDDTRFVGNPFVVGPPNIRFYAGVPLRIAKGEMAAVTIGTLCVVDILPRSLPDDHLTTLCELARVAESLLEARLATIAAVDLAEQRHAHAEAMMRRQRQFRQAERMANIGSWRLTLADNRTQWSDQVWAIHELPIGEMPPLDAALDFYPPHARTLLSATIARAIETGQPFDVETDFITARGNKRRVRSIGEVELRDGKPVALIGVFQDITVQYEMEQALRRTASMDDLTRLANRASFNDALDGRIAVAKAEGESLALLLIDLDGFKTINDRCGHLAGDDLLRDIAGRLRAPYLADCFVARLGGDEFVLIVSGETDHRDLDALIRRLLNDLNCSVAGPDGGLKVSGTIGASWLTGEVKGRRELLHRADTALYQAKRALRGSARIFNDPRMILAGGGDGALLAVG